MRSAVITNTYSLEKQTRWAAIPTTRVHDRQCPFKMSINNVGTALLHELDLDCQHSYPPGLHTLDTDHFVVDQQHDSCQ
jgi:hypothetical protein